mmetsp:Transcript_29624/g.81433  ORF Transcript_29624/g.81433 Transcript_29624/m.81433 type:complete len:147 (+) Transcript_29624:1765-2205(+)
MVINRQIHLLESQRSINEQHGVVHVFGDNAVMKVERLIDWEMKHMARSVLIEDLRQNLGVVPTGFAGFVAHNRIKIFGKVEDAALNQYEKNRMVQKQLGCHLSRNACGRSINQSINQSSLVVLPSEMVRSDGGVPRRSCPFCGVCR